MVTSDNHLLNVAMPQSVNYVSGILCKRCVRYEPFGAGEGNRTLVSSLGSSHSTIELHPPKKIPQ